MRLNDVDIEDLYNLCAVYAERRSGTRQSWKSLCKDPAKHFECWDDLLVGDIVVWEVEPYDFTAYASRIENNHLLTPWLRKERHFGVMEGDNLISDLSYVHDRNGDQWPYIRFRHITDVRTPDYYFPRIATEKGE